MSQFMHHSVLTEGSCIGKVRGASLAPRWRASQTCFLCHRRAVLTVSLSVLYVEDTQHHEIKR